MIYWLLFLFFMYCLVGYYDKSKNKNLLLFLIILFTVYFSTFRDGLGTDYTAYKSYCEYDRVYSLSWIVKEPFPALIYSFCYNTKLSAIVFFFISSVLTCSISFWVYSRYNNFWISAFVFLTYTNLYLASFNLVRQFVAAVLVLLGTYLFLIKRKSLWFFLFIMLAFLWHKSAIIGVCIYFLNDQKINPVIWSIAIILSWFFPVNIIFDIPIIGNLFNILEYTDYYTYDSATSYSKTSITNLYMHFLILCLMFNHSKIQNSRIENKKGFYLALKLSIFSLIFSNISATSLPFAYRFAIFFSLFIPIALSYFPIIVDKTTSFLIVIIPFFILLMSVLILHRNDRVFCPQRILPIESIYDENYHPYDNPDVIIIH